MANPKHLKILNQGVYAWNKWRVENPDVEPDLSGIILNCALLINVNFSGTFFLKSSIVCSELPYANFTGAFLKEVNFNETALAHASFNSSVLTWTNFSHAKLNEADFSGADLGWTTFGNNDLSQAKGLDTTNHVGPSILDIKTLYRSKGNIPEVFLRGCGIPEAFIAQIPALLSSIEPIQFYKCFISFTEADDLFSERLYNDLQGKSVRCWRWKEDAKWGKTLMRSIDEAVRLYDKLIVICSEQSLNSPAVIREIERALQKEDDLARQGKEAEVLFPIRLDDYLFTEWDHHRKADVIAKNVGDFRNLNEPEQYKKAFDRLLRDLKAGE
jgi:hypothetical protein